MFFLDNMEKYGKTHMFIGLCSLNVENYTCLLACINSDCGPLPKTQLPDTKTEPKICLQGGHQPITNRVVTPTSRVLIPVTNL